MKIVKPFVISVVVWGILLVIDIITTLINTVSQKEVSRLVQSTFLGEDPKITSLMGVVFSSYNGLSLSFRFFVILILFISAGICLANRTILYQKLKEKNLLG